MTPTPVKRDRRWTRAQRDLLQQSPRVGTSVLRRRSGDMDILLCSQFGKLFQLPVVRWHNCTKLIGSLLSRQLITIHKFELWFTVGRHPLRFSLDEFHGITGVNCGSFDVGVSDADEIPVYDSDAGEAGSSMDSSAEGSSPAEPQGGDVGSGDMDILLCSQFGKLVQLPVVRWHNCTKLIGSLLSRQLITIRKFELWFTVGRHPLRFSLDEFHGITGLNCGSFDVGVSDADEIPGFTMWNKLFDTTLGGITVKGSDDESDSKVDLKDYQEYLEKHHNSDSDSSEDSNMGP
ncbi:hypothetical protein F2Q69_00053575 [Brassica cretica]|uniref:DUF1985 domain-containing protein n=1 Tax=Brassica cretica TaxID=69181 RepID=A0A8S9N9D3_BRACR|nr:hypothetical protein F2Q69_00053575 [Brassica cretica]